VWERGMKRYQSLKLVYEIQTRYQGWVTEQSKADQEKAEQEKVEQERVGDQKQ
jgi:hypothetical protein